MAKDKSRPVSRPASQSAPKGNFSRRHKTGEPHAAATARYRENRGPAARRARAQTRAAARAKRSTAEQLKLLQDRPGFSEREIARLKRLKKPKAA